MKAKKLITLFLTIAALSVPTACALNFNGNADTLSQLQNIDDPALSSIYEGLSQVIEQADFRDEISLNDVAGAVWSAADAIEQVEDVTFTSATLVRVVDGDTIVVSIDNEQYKVRLIGINTPESVASKEYEKRSGNQNSAEGKLASAFTKQLLSDVQTVYLQKDTSDTDHYGRLLRYVWLEKPDDPYDIKEVAAKMLNGILVLEKVAEPKTYQPDTAYQQTFETLYEMELD